MSERIKKVNQVLKRELAKIIAKEIDLPLAVLLTVTNVETISDLREAKVFISVFPEAKTGLVMKILNKEIYNLQQILNKRIRIKYVPKIRFVVDKELRQAQEIDSVLENLKNEGK